MRKVTKYLALFAFTLLMSATALAQNPGDPEEDPDASVPLDGGLFSVLLSGAGIGVYRLIKRKRG